MIHSRPFLFLALIAAGVAQDKSAAPEPQVFNFQTLTAGPVPEEGFTATDQEAKFVIGVEGESKYLELLPQPLVDGGMLAGKSVQGPCTVTAKIKATGKRRSQPRFGIGVHGMNGPRLRMVAARKQLELIIPRDSEEPVATADYAGWESGKWAWLELSVATVEGGSLIEGRMWAEGGTRPDKPVITFKTMTPPGQGKASVWGTPYSELPIQFDDITVK